MSKSEVVASVNIESFIASKTSWEPGSGLVKLGSRSLDTLLTLVWRLLCFSLAVVCLLQRLWQGGEYSNFHCSNWRRNGTKQLPVNLSRRLWRQEISKFLLCWRKTGSVTCGSAEQKLHRHLILMGIAMEVIMIDCTKVRAIPSPRPGQAPFTGRLRQIPEDTASFLQQSGQTPMSITTTGQPDAE